MSMFFKARHKPHFLTFLFSFGLFFFICISLTSIGENLGIIDSNSTDYKNRAWYVIELGNIPVGTAVISKKEEKGDGNLPYKYEIQFASRLGISPIISEISIQVQKSNDPSSIQIVQKFLSRSQPDDSSQLKETQAKKENVVIAQTDNLIEKNDTFVTKKKNFFLEDNQSSSFQDVLSPFPNNFLNLEDSFTASYARDKFLQTAVINLKGNVPLKFKRINEKKYKEEVKQIASQRVDLEFVNNLQNGSDEMENLFKNLVACQSEMENLNKSILKQMPHESYLMYRRIINLDQFCSRLESALNAVEDETVDEKLTTIASHVKNLLNEDPRELPHAVSQFPDRTIYYNNGVSFLWPKMTTVLIQNSVDEILNLFRLDLNRKSLLTIQLKISKMQHKAVVRAEIEQINSPVNFLVQTRTSHASPSYFLNGLFFANHTEQDLGEICKKNSGNVGIDFDDPTQNIVNSTGIRGVWDLKTKLTTARMFAIRSTLEKSCNNVYFKGDPGMERFLKQELDTFKTESLSLENSLLLSNYDQKKLWVMPGKYRITISSIINEKVISVQEFVVGENTQTNVVANVH